jgi:hypothetical protein
LFDERSSELPRRPITEMRDVFVTAGSDDTPVLRTGDN